MIRGFRQIAVLTLASRVLGMLRDMMFAYFLGATGLMDGWAIAFKVPNLARRIFGEGAASSSLIPVYSEQAEKDRGQANRLAFTVVTVVLVLLTAVVLAGEGVLWMWRTFFSAHESTDLKLTLAAIMLPYMLLICAAALFAGVLNANRHFAAPAAAPIVLNVFLIGALCVTGWVLHTEPRAQVVAVAAVVLVAGTVQLLMQMPPLLARGIRFRPSWNVGSDAFRKVILLMGPMVLGLTVTQINTLADDFIALWFSGSPEKGASFVWFSREIAYPVWEGAVSRLFYSQRLYQFPLGVFGISLATAIFPVMSAEAARRDFSAFAATVSRGLRCAVFIALPATVGLLLVARPVVSVILQRGQFSPADAVATAGVLCFYVLGLCGYFAQQVLTRAFYSLHESKVPAKSACVAVAVNIVLNLTLIWVLGAAGLAAATAACSYLQVAILAVALRRRLARPIFAALAVAIVKVLGATAGMALAIGVALHLLRAQHGLVQLAVVVPVGAAVYVGLSRLLRIEMLSLLAASKDSDSRQGGLTGPDRV